MYKFSLIVLIFISIFSFSQIQRSTSAKASLYKIEWLTGKWKQESHRGTLYEIWSKTNDSLFSGKSFMISKGDTSFSEKVEIKIINGELFYIPTVSDQNNSEAIFFKMISDSSAVFVFENKAHDFPQRIIYRHPHPDSLIAAIEGMNNGKFSRQEFRMVKIIK